MYLKVICAWCKKLLRIEEIDTENPNTVISHGICKKCKAKLRKEIENEGNNNIRTSKK